MPLDFNEWVYLILLSVMLAGQVLIALTLIFISGYLVLLRLDLDQKLLSKNRFFSSLRRRFQL